MTERTNTPDDDPAVRAAGRLHANSRLSGWMTPEKTADAIRAAYAPLIASVRELLGEIHRPDDGLYVSEVLLMRSLTDAIEVVRKEWERARDWGLALQSLTPGGSEFVDDPERCVAYVREMRVSQHETIVRQQRQLAMLSSQIAESDRRLTLVNADKMKWVDEAARQSDLLAASNAENEHIIGIAKRRQQHVTELLAENVRLRDQLPVGMKDCTIQFRECEKGHGRLIATNWVDHGCDVCGHDELRRQITERDRLIERQQRELLGIDADSFVTPQPPDQERVEPDTLCWFNYQFEELVQVRRCAVLRSKHGAVKNHEFVADPPTGPNRVPWSEWHHCKPPLGNPTREEAMEQVTYLRGIIERLRALDASKLPCGCNARFALTIGGACTICEMERLRAKLAEAEREQAITAKVIQSQQETIRRLTVTPVRLEVREKVAIQVLRTARELTENGAVESWRTLGSYWRNHWLMKADRIIAILADEQSAGNAGGTNAI